MNEQSLEDMAEQEPPRRLKGRRRSLRDIPPEAHAPVSAEPDLGADVDEQDDAEPRAAVAPTPPAPASARAAKAAAADGKVLQEMRTNEDRAIRDWLDELSGAGAIRVSVIRQLPAMWKGKNVKGLLATYQTAIDEDFIRDTHGGGTFYLRVMRPRRTGTGFEYAGGKVVEIVGDPRLDDVYREEAQEKQQQHATPSADIIKTVVGTLERQLEKAQEKENRGAGLDYDAMRAATAPLQAQLDQLNRERRELQTQLLQAQAHKPAPPPNEDFKDKILEKMLDVENSRIAGIRTQHESELRQIKQSAIDTEARLRDSFERDKQTINMSHEREIAALKSAYDIKTGALETAFATQRALMEGELRRLDAALSESKAELAALRAKKEKSLLEQINDVNAIKEAIGLGEEEKEEKSMLDKVLESGAPILQNILAKQQEGGAAAGGVVQAPVQAPQQQPRPATKLLRGPEGLYTQGPNGQINLVRRSPQRAAPGVQQKAEPGKPLAKKVPEIAPATVKIAIDYLETAYRNSQPPETVAQSVKSMVPSDVLTAIRVLGVDGFLDDVARIDGTSPLSSQGGRNWARKLAKTLLGA
jgi:hypothetical protein